MNDAAIYFKSLELTDFRTFGKASIDLVNKFNVLPQWTLLLGDNGVGKSTILQCIAWMKPQFPEPGAPGQNLELDEIEPLINNEENDTLINMLRRQKGLRVASKVTATFIAKKTLKTTVARERPQTCTSSFSMLTNKAGDLSKVTPTITTNSKRTFYKNSILIYAYSASRMLGKQNLNDSDLEDTIPSFLAEKTTLFDAQEILHTLRYAELGSESERGKYTAFLQTVKEMLVALLPDIDRISDIQIIEPKLVGRKLAPPKILLSNKHGKKIPFDNYSLGYKTVMSLTIDLAWRLFNRFDRKPLEQPAIVLIDEIDLHLHPRWQTSIMDSLSAHFPRVQFIATAHSPLMVQAALGGNYAVLRESANGVEIISEPDDVEGWRVDQILTSELFGLKSARGPVYDSLLAEREKLSRKFKLTASEKRRLDEITDKLSMYPPGDTPEEIKNLKFLSAEVNKIRESKKKITV
jgi:energy-coupling factor transporter ATP-binding protein EcfA2